MFYVKIDGKLLKKTGWKTERGAYNAIMRYIPHPHPLKAWMEMSKRVQDAVTSVAVSGMTLTSINGYSVLVWEEVCEE